MRYYPYGKTRYTWGATPTDRRFTGQIEDAEIGLYFYNARYYDPALGRFVQADSIVPAPGNPQSLNRYSYVYNNPLKYVDVDGHFPWIVAGGLAGMAIAYGGQVVGNLNSGMELGDALTTNIDTRAIATGGLIGMAAGTGIGLLAPGMASLATGGTLATVAGGTTTAACADGDCGNELRTVIESADYLAQELPELEGSWAGAFDGIIQQVTLKAGSVLPRVGDPGNWFGIQVPQSVAEAETLYNAAKWGNAIDAVHMYELTQDVTGYLGNVAGGTGNQFFIPYSVDVREVTKIIADRLLH